MVTLTGYRTYPLATPEGAAIPIDILEPMEALDPIGISAVALPAAIDILNSTSRFLEIWATTDCSIGFNVTPVDGGAEKGIYHLRAGDPRLLLPAGAYISAITTGDSGYLMVNLLNLWEATKKDYQTTTGE